MIFTLPAGWDNPADSADFFQIGPAGSDIVGVYLFRSPKAASQDASFPETAMPGVGGSSKEIVAWIRTCQASSSATSRRSRSAA